MDLGHGDRTYMGKDGKSSPNHRKSMGKIKNLEQKKGFEHESLDFINTWR